MKFYERKPIKSQYYGYIIDYSDDFETIPLSKQVYITNGKIFELRRQA